MLRNKHIFITGGAGFIGTQMLARVLDDNQVTVLDTLHRNALAETGLADHPTLRLVKENVRVPALVSEFMKGATHVVHLASIAEVDTVINNPLLTMDVLHQGDLQRPRGRHR